MSRHLKSIVISRLASSCATFVKLPKNATPHTRGVHYFTADLGIDLIWGAMDSVKEGQKRKKRIVVRRSRFRPGLFELYTYHFPKTWSAGCVANREIIKEAQRLAHAIERDHSHEALEWRVNFLMNYFKYYKKGQKPAPGVIAYGHFFPFVYVSIYHSLRSALSSQTASLSAQDPSALPSLTPALPSPVSTAPALTEDISFVPVERRRLQAFARHRQTFSRAFLGALPPLLL